MTTTEPRHGRLLPLAAPDTGDLVKLATDHLYAGTEHADPDQIAAATAYALVAIANSLDRLAARHAPDTPPTWVNLAPLHDDR